MYSLSELKLSQPLKVAAATLSLAKKGLPPPIVMHVPLLHVGTVLREMQEPPPIRLLRGPFVLVRFAVPVFELVLVRLSLSRVLLVPLPSFKVLEELLFVIIVFVVRLVFLALDKLVEV